MWDEQYSGFFVYTEAVNLLLRTYDRESYIEKEVEYLDRIIQRDGETELTVARKLREANRNFGSVYFKLELIRRFIWGVNPTVKPLMTNYAQVR